MDDTNANVNKDQPVTISAPPAAPVTIDPQNPLPEASFFWRRLFAAAISANAVVFVWFAAAWLVGGQQWQYLYGLTKFVILGSGLILTYYFIAPSAAELTNIIQSASIIKRGIASAAEKAVGAAESGLGARFRPSGSADSQISGAPASGASAVDSTPDDIPDSVR